MLIFLDTVLLWLLANPLGGPRSQTLRQTVRQCVAAGDEIAVAEICDYEARRELVRRNASRQIDNLDQIVSANTYVPLDTNTMRDAAVIWARLRNTGRPTASDDALDGDVILGAQALRQGSHLVATENLRHLGRICNAIDWRNL